MLPTQLHPRRHPPPCRDGRFNSTVRLRLLFLWSAVKDPILALVPKLCAKGFPLAIRTSNALPSAAAPPNAATPNPMRRPDYYVLPLPPVSPRACSAAVEPRPHLTLQHLALLKPLQVQLLKVAITSTFEMASQCRSLRTAKRFRGLDESLSPIQDCFELSR